LAIYRQIGFGANPNPLPLPLILDLIMIGVGLAMWKELTVPMRHVLALQIFGIAFFYGSLGFAILAHRVREMFSVFWVVFLAQSPKTSPVVRWATVVFGVFCAIAYTYVYWLNPEEVFFS
jgi:hypothetical protein